MLQALIDILKIVAALAILVALVHYALTQGLPARGRGRWRNVLRDLDGRREKHK